ncbi:MAG: TusE/DsrC/DsvC family sulfur relay protein [Rhodocyclaceae bacterium]|nr:TusE/DsrC/DsvC family sulfur relay protein [Rhodocyclaceae bacterium]
MQPELDMPARDAEGYLIEPAQWNDTVAEVLAGELGIALEEDHWDAIRFMRSYYDEHQVAADARHVIKHLERRHPGVARKRLFELFPYGYPAQACKIAGMKRPRAWSTG